MEQFEKDWFIRATKEKVDYPLYKVEYKDKNLIYTRVDHIPKIKEFIESSFEIPLKEDLYFGYSVNSDLTPNGIFHNRAVLCSDNSYYIFNEHSFMPEFVKLISLEEVNSVYAKEYPKSLDECVEVIVND